MLQYIENNSISEILSYNITYRKHILKTIRGYKNFEKIYEVLNTKFSLSSTEDLPYLAPDLSYN
jgi:hypothetical protein